MPHPWAPAFARVTVWWVAGFAGDDEGVVGTGGNFGALKQPRVLSRGCPILQCLCGPFPIYAAGAERRFSGS